MDPWDYVGWALLGLVISVGSVYVLIFVALAANVIEQWRESRRDGNELKQDDLQPNTYTATKYETAWDAWYGQAWGQSKWQKGSDG